MKNRTSSITWKATSHGSQARNLGERRITRWSHPHELREHVGIGHELVGFDVFAPSFYEDVQHVGCARPRRRRRDRQAVTFEQPNERRAVANDR